MKITVVYGTERKGCTYTIAQKLINSFSMEYMLEKSVSSGNSDPIFTNWHQRVGKKTTQASPKLFKQNRQRMRKRYKSLMHGLNYANKVGQGCYKKSTKLTRLFAQDATGQCRLWQ